MAKQQFRCINCKSLFSTWLELIRHRGLAIGQSRQETRAACKDR